ncbi:MAG: symmetrical bis(5'-nucleosyl)-tetraphosphatase [Myxococcales bacterium]|nr:symmetrical bis(5'-nucleosyl)-tetraphosphatase [Myxococcales bacterium]
MQGCARTLDALLTRIEFNPTVDRLWFGGDLVNGGPDSLGVLRRLKTLGPAATTVLGNHDLYLLARASGLPPRKRDTLDPVLAAPDADDLLDWLRRQPVMLVARNHVLVHAGLLPQWRLTEAAFWASQVEGQLRGPEWRGFVLDQILSKTPVDWAKCGPVGRLRMALAAFTRLRMVDGQGHPHFGYKGPPEGAPGDLRPWYASRRRGPNSPTLLFAHWAAHGFARMPGLVALDDGCVWGNNLVAWRVDDGVIFRQPALDGGHLPGPKDRR